MPRQRQHPTAGGYAPQPRNPVAGQTYGHGADQQRLNQVMPTPQVQPRPGATVAQPGATVAPPAAGYDHEAAIAAAQALAGDTGVLQRPTQRPTEPITAGLSRGPGPGPEVLGAVRGSPTGDMFRRLAVETGDSYFADLANQARA